MQKKSRKLCTCYFGIGSKRLSNSPVFTSSVFRNGKSFTHFDEGVEGEQKTVDLQ